MAYRDDPLFAATLRDARAGAKPTAATVNMTGDAIDQAHAKAASSLSRPTTFSLKLMVVASPASAKGDLGALSCWNFTPRITWYESLLSGQERPVMRKKCPDTRAKTPCYRREPESGRAGAQAFEISPGITSPGAKGTTKSPVSGSNTRKFPVLTLISREFCERPFAKDCAHRHADLIFLE